MSENGHDVFSADVLNLLEALPDSTSLHNANGQALWISRKSQTMLQNDGDNLLGSKFFSEVNPQDRIEILKSFSDSAIRDSEQIVSFRRQHSSDNGMLELRTFELRIAPYECTTGKYLLAIIKDVSNQEQSLSIAQDDPQNDDGLNSTKNLFISNMSHELRTPLNAIVGFSQILMGESAIELSNDKKFEYSRLINHSSVHLLNIINDVLDLSKLGAGKFQINKELFDLKSEIKSTLKLMEPIAEKAEVTLKYEIDESIPELTADQRALRQILINLLANAIKFSKSGNIVLVKASRKLRKVHIEVCDQGIGMAQETVSKLGTAFFQAEQETSKQFEGTGLGLSIVCGLVKLHDGKVSFESQPGKGTNVCVELPISTGAAVPIPANPNDEIIFLNKSKEPNLLRRLDVNSNIRKTG